MARYETIIKGGTIVDGARTPRYVSDIAIKEGKIAQIGGLKGSSADNVLEASGLIVAPGFVDLHTHYDAQIQWDPYCSVSGWHGVTSLVLGNCGFGFAPCQPEFRQRAMLALTRTEAIPLKAMQAGMLWDWVTFPEFLDSLDRIPKGLNIITYVALTPIYAWVMGWEEAKKRRPTKAELDQMCQLLHEAMDHGACGWSAQVRPGSLEGGNAQLDYDGTPMITDLMTEEEMLAFGRVLAERDEGFIELSYRAVGEAYRERGDDEGGGAATKKFFEKLAEVSGRPILYQTVATNTRNVEQHREDLRWLADCARRGLRVYGQGSTNQGGQELTLEDYNLFDDVPSWRAVTMGTLAERKAQMQDPALRNRLREDWDAGIRPGQNIQGSVAGLICQGVGNPEFAHYEGMTVGAIAEKENKHIVDAFLDLVVADDLKTEFEAKQYRDNAQYTAEVLHSPHVVAGLSDGGAHLKFLSNGGFPTQHLTWLVRDEQVVSLEEMHYKLSYLPAHIAGFKDRGFLREGAPADIVMYDLDKLKVLPTTIAHDLPGGEWRRITMGEGYRWIMVNGEVTFEDGKPTGALPGKLLRHGRG